MEQAQETTADQFTPAQRLAAWSVHAFTLTGLVWACLAIVAMSHGHFLAMWGWLGVALVVDGLDGTLARKFRVKEVIPWFDGTTLDNVVDYLTWTFIPAVFMYLHIRLGSWIIAGILLLLVCVSSMFCYCNLKAKSSEYFFVGFPAAWNVVVLYLYLLGLPAWLNAIVVVVMSVLTLVPIQFVHPFRVKKGMAVNIPVTVVWLVCTIWMTVIAPAKPVILMIVWWAAGLYFLGVGAVRTFTLRRELAEARA